MRTSAEIEKAFKLMDSLNMRPIIPFSGEYVSHNFAFINDD